MKPLKRKEENSIIANFYITEDRIIVMESCYIRANRLYWVEMKMLKIRLAD